MTERKKATQIWKESFEKGKEMGRNKRLEHNKKIRKLFGRKKDEEI